MFCLKEINLKNFRCYEAQKFEFNDSINIFVGKNATGKTSAVEAIHYLSFARSFRTSKDQEIIKNDQENFFIRAKFERDDQEDVLEIGYDGKSKLISFNNTKISSLSKMVGYFGVVVFAPDDLNVIKQEPKLRRKLIDTTICQIDKLYLASLSSLKRLYKEKSAYLKEKVGLVDEKYIETLNLEMAKASEYIIKARKSFIEELNILCKETIALINNSEVVDLAYVANVTCENIYDFAKAKVRDDILASTTTWGPLRDDLNISINGANASSIASQGQIRTIAIAIKLAIVKYYKRRGQNIIVILDDVLSELDAERQNALMEVLKDNNQVFITSTDLNLLDPKYLENSHIIRL